jgi:hypothetical protein
MPGAERSEPPLSCALRIRQIQIWNLIERNRHVPRLLEAMHLAKINRIGYL